MKRIALLLAALTLRWLNGKPDQRAAHRAIVAVVAAAAMVAILSPAPATADHDHNCVWSGGAWVGQGLCPGMPGYDDPHWEPTSTPEPTVTSEPTETAAPTETPAPTEEPEPTETAEPTPTSTATRPSRPTAEDVEKVRDQVLERVRQRQATQSPTTPAPVVTGPVIDTDIPYEHRNHPRGW